MDKTLKIILATILLIAVFEMPYWFYQNLRICSFIIFTYLAYDSYKKDNSVVWSIIYIALAILFQPFEKIAIPKFGWKVVDSCAAIILMVSLVKFRPKKQLKPKLKNKIMSKSIENNKCPYDFKKLDSIEFPSEPIVLKEATDDVFATVDNGNGIDYLTFKEFKKYKSIVYNRPLDFGSLNISDEELNNLSYEIERQKKELKNKH